MPLLVISSGPTIGSISTRLPAPSSLDRCLVASGLDAFSIAAAICRGRRLAATMCSFNQRVVVSASRLRARAALARSIRHGSPFEDHYSDRTPKISNCYIRPGPRMASAKNATSVPKVASASGRSVKSRANQRRRLVFAHLDHAASRLGLGADAPSGQKGARERHGREVDRDCFA
jgi:hypothetical protein